MSMKNFRGLPQWLKRQYARGNVFSPAVLMTVFCWLAFNGRAVELQAVPIRLPAAAIHLKPIQAMDRSQHLNLAIGLPLRNREALNQVLRQIYDPTSPDYHHYLTPEQFTEQFGPTEQD